MKKEEKVGHNVYLDEEQKRLKSRFFLALGTEGKKTVCLEWEFKNGGIS